MKLDLKLMETRVHEILDKHTHLYGIKVTSSGERRLLDVSVDKYGGMSLDECSELHRKFYNSDFYSDYEEYDVTFGTPGLGRKCLFPTDFHFHDDKLFELTTQNGDVLVGQVKILDSDNELLEVTQLKDKSSSDEVNSRTQLNWSEIKKAKFYVEF